MNPVRFEILLELFGDDDTLSIFTEQSMVQSWLDVEVALAGAQAELGTITAATARAIADAATLANLDLSALWSSARIVGYPILPLITQIEAKLPPEHAGSVHLGATTQDIMDSGLALQLRATHRRQHDLITTLGDQLAEVCANHVQTVMAARTHAQQAVPTVLGAKLSVYLAEVSRQRARLATAAADVTVVSLFGAGGTSSAYGPDAALLRQRVAERLGLRNCDVPWHVARDSLAAYASACTSAAATCARLAREVIDLARTEIAEVSEAGGHLRGASSTMPQKQNPISSEGIIGLAVSAEALNTAMPRVMEAGHERAAGEWQIELHVLPQIVCLANSALLTTVDMLAGLQIHPERMRRNLGADGDLIMAEAYMMHLTPVLGRASAHELVYAAASQARESGESLLAVLRRTSPPAARDQLSAELQPDDYLGDPAHVISSALSAWRTQGEKSDESGA